MISRIGSLLVPSVIKRSYTAKFVVSIVFVLVVIGSVGAIGYVQVNDTIERDSQDNLNTSASMQADSISEWVRSIESQTKSISDNQEVQDADTTAALRAALNSERVHHFHVASVHYFDAESGEMLASTAGDYDEPGLSLDEIDEPWADVSIRDQLQSDSQVWSSNTSYDHSDLSSRVIAFASRDTSNTDRVIVTEATIDLRIDALHQPGLNHSTAILNQYGETVISPLEGAVNVDQREVRDAVDRVVENERVEFVDHGGTLRAYAPVAGSNWVAVSSVPEADAFAVRDAVGFNVLLIVLGGIVTLGFVGIVLGRQTVKPLGRLKRRAELMEQGDLDVDLETRRTDEIGRLFHAFDSMRTSLRNQIDEVEAARDEADRMNVHLEQKATEYSEVMQECADGDLTRRMEPESESEAMEEIAGEFNEMITEIEETVQRLANFATAVATSSEEVTASAEEVRSASVQVTESIQEISDGAERQNESLQSVNQEMSGLSTTTEEIAASSNQVATLAERTATTGQEGREAADDAITGMNEIEEESDRAVAEIEALEAQIDQIDELVEFISEVAEQTNMLALNANIEAARSAETGGEGFGVVANEVKELAAETKTAADDIEDRIEEIKAQTRRTSEEVQQTSQQIADHRDAVENAAEALENIARFAQETNDGVQDISAATEQQAASTQEVVAMVDEASVISEETTVEAENVAAAAEEQTSSLTEVSHSVSDLAHQAARLSEALDHFETDAAGGPHGVLPEGDDEDDDDDDWAGPVEEELAPAGGDEVPADETGAEAARENDWSIDDVAEPAPAVAEEPNDDRAGDAETDVDEVPADETGAQPAHPAEGASDAVEDELFSFVDSSAVADAPDDAQEAPASGDDAVGDDESSGDEAPDEEAEDDVPADADDAN